MLQETGTVVELHPKVAVILCPKSTFCLYGKALGIRQKDDKRHMRIKARNPLGARLEDRVRLAGKPSRMLLALFLLYVLPLVGLIFGALAGAVLGAYLSIDIDPNLLAALLGLGLMTGAFILVRIGRKAVPSNLFMPEVIEILPGEEILAEEY
jgi:sigma-E factor negative regulatory protein RseC